MITNFRKKQLTEQDIRWLILINQTDPVVTKIDRNLVMISCRSFADLENEKRRALAFINSRSSEEEGGCI